MCEAGKPGSLPKHASTTLSRAVKQDCQQYSQLCTSFQEGQSALQAAVAKPQMMQALQAVSGPWHNEQQVLCGHARA